MRACLAWSLACLGMLPVPLLSLSVSPYTTPQTPPYAYLKVQITTLNGNCNITLTIHLNSYNITYNTQHNLQQLYNVVLHDSAPVSKGTTRHTRVRRAKLVRLNMTQDYTIELSRMLRSYMNITIHYIYE